MRIKISSNKIGYDLTLYGKYSFLCGDSGNGKTTLHKLLTQYLFTPKAVKYSSDIQVYPVAAQADEDVLQKHKGELLVIDERALLLKNPNISKLLKESPNYFLIISRKNFNYLPVSTDNYFTLEKTGKVMHNVPIFPRFNIKSFLA